MPQEQAISYAPLDDFDECYKDFRFVHPRQERVIRESIRSLGQLAPVVATRRSQKLALVDGFKRFGAAQKLGIEQLMVRELALTEQGVLAAMYNLNRHGAGLTDFEQAMVVRALHRKHGLSQKEVGQVLSKHKSWVCRRLQMAEQLNEQVQEDLRVGLLSVSLVRELLRLPRGNQPEVALCLSRHGLTVREASRLITLFGEMTEREDQEALLEQPVRHLSSEHLSFFYDQRLSPAANRLRSTLHSFQKAARCLLKECQDFTFSNSTTPEEEALTPPLKESLASLLELEGLLQKKLGVQEESHVSQD